MLMQIKRLFGGRIRSFIRCVHVNYESKRDEDFYDIQLDVKGCANVIESFRRYTAKEMLDGENQYDAEKLGKQDAEKGVIFTELPPVLTIHLKRFDFDFQRMVTNNNTNIIFVAASQSSQSHFIFIAKLLPSILDMILHCISITSSFNISPPEIPSSDISFLFTGLRKNSRPLRIPSEIVP